jgi:hypothetical protein
MDILTNLVVCKSNGADIRTTSADFQPIVFSNNKQKDDFRRQKERELMQKEKQDNPDHPATVSVYLVLREEKEIQAPIIEEELPTCQWRKPQFKQRQ